MVRLVQTAQVRKIDSAQCASSGCCCGWCKQHRGSPDRHGYPASERLGYSEIDLHNRTWLRLRRIHYRCGDRHGGPRLHQWM